MTSWGSTSDWDAAQSESGVAHESVTNTDHGDATQIKQGYSYSSPLYSTNLVAYWPLHENNSGTVYDVWGGNDLSVTTSPTQGVTGILDSTAYNFTGGSSEETETSSVAFANFGTGDMSISAWVRVTGSQPRNHIIIHRRSGANPRKGYAFGARSGNLGAVFEDENDNLINFKGTDINDSTWHHVAVVKEGNGATTYLDGVADASGSASTFGNYDTSKKLKIGQTSDGDSNYPEAFDGDIAEVSLYNTALSGSQIQALYDTVASPSQLTTAAKSL